MKRVVKAAVAASLLVTGIVGASAPASAHGDAGVAVAAGILGLGVGAAIASDHPHYVRYAPPPPPPPYYDEPPYYAPPPPPGYYGYGRCRTEWHWSRYWGDYVRERRCY